MNPDISEGELFKRARSGIREALLIFLDVYAPRHHKRLDRQLRVAPGAGFDKDDVFQTAFQMALEAFDQHGCVDRPAVPLPPERYRYTAVVTNAPSPVKWAFDGCYGHGSDIPGRPAVVAGLPGKSPGAQHC